MKRTCLLYGFAVALGASVLQWIQYSYRVKLLTTEAYVAAVALAFTALGLWAGRRLTPPTVTAGTRNTQAITALGISPRELEVLDLLAEGHTNKTIASQLHVSPNTVKTHLRHLYAKLEVSRRTQAVQRARDLRLLV
ncbi:MAG: response regulator transcription factor [Myxococcales bacterium FL481]|nr:MAG: response regulator transcription factor [Myxococcales bacterium FL481]